MDSVFVGGFLCIVLKGYGLFVCGLWGMLFVMVFLEWCGGF